MDGQPHQQKPDLDNLKKSLLDALFEDDSHIWDARTSKVWGETGMIIIEEIK
ncbi:endodeoxyribonuclease RusA [Enterobacter cloacae]|nr:endodeoxyribonuclease RusA [Enterobacter cloacae]